MSKRRGNGEGAIYLTKQGRWCAVLTVGYDENGKRKRRYLYGRTKGDVLEKLNETRNQVSTGSVTEASRVTVAEFVTAWLEAAETRIRPTTLSTYKSLAKNHITPHLGGIRLSRLTPVHLQHWQTSLARADVSLPQQRSVHVLLKTILKHALRQGLLVRNPLEALEKPRVPEKELQVLNPEQVRILLEKSRDHRLGALVALAVGTGARQGELFGLQWRDLDLDEAWLTIQRTLTEARGEIAFGEPKTKRSRRRIDLPAYAVEALRRHRDRQPATPHPTMLLFTDTRGHPLRKSNFTRRVWHPMLEAAELPRVRFHSLRHSHVTALLAGGGNLKAVSERVGHSRTSMTADVYAHAVQGMQRELADQLDRMFA